MLKKAIVISVLAVLLIPAINLSAEEKKAEHYLAAQHQVKQQPGRKQLRTRIGELEQRLERIEQLLERKAKAKKSPKKGPQKGICPKAETPGRDNRPKKQRSQKATRQGGFQQGRMKMQEWFEQLERAYDENNMEKIGRLIKRSKKFREQMKKRREEFREEHPYAAERFGRGFGRRNRPRCGPCPERSCGGRQDRERDSGPRRGGGGRGGFGGRGWGGSRGGYGYDKPERGLRQRQYRHRQEQQWQDHDRNW